MQIGLVKAHGTVNSIGVQVYGLKGDVNWIGISVYFVILLSKIVYVIHNFEIGSIYINIDSCLHKKD